MATTKLSVRELRRLLRTLQRLTGQLEELSMKRHLLDNLPEQRLGEIGGLVRRMGKDMRAIIRRIDTIEKQITDC